MRLYRTECQPLCWDQQKSCKRWESEPRLAASIFHAQIAAAWQKSRRGAHFEQLTGNCTVGLSDTRVQQKE
eukprot:CAMPEP_0171059116 /NCGR_PEP_ID=MMETSP0766_2-20121228/2993_2 /TAXON_ID=439317 /ORGANISM="Gambierdiscus australes, Strain CAWD 149" /LENGTH=70 /DNA_ID=CAMNT_0011514525 /DNA_START=159 /DNA_END=368 /DNA_ORIENTATION=-